VVTPGRASLAGLATALAATGARCDEVQLTGWVSVANPSAKDRLLQALGPARAGESRQANLREQNGQSYLVVRLVLTGKALGAWQSRVQALQKALDAVSTGTAEMTVQLGGPAPDGSLTEVAAKALGALAAVDRQPWSDTRAASVAGRTKDLPPSPFGVNVQVAVRRDAVKGQTRVWVAWPALQQEY
jgi:hypothetical protein